MTSLGWTNKICQKKRKKTTFRPDWTKLVFLPFSTSRFVFLPIYKILLVSIFSFLVEQIHRISYIAENLSSSSSLHDLIAADNAKWKRKSCQHAFMILDLWLISFGFLLPVYFPYLFFHFIYLLIFLLLSNKSLAFSMPHKLTLGWNFSTKQEDFFTAKCIFTLKTDFCEFCSEN